MSKGKSYCFRHDAGPSGSSSAPAFVLWQSNSAAFLFCGAEQGPDRVFQFLLRVLSVKVWSLSRNPLTCRDFSAYLSPMQLRSADALFSGPTMFPYTDGAVSLPGAAPPPPPPRADDHHVVHVVPSPPVVSSYTAAGAASVDTASMPYGGYSSYPLYGAPHGPSPMSLRSYGVFPGHVPYAAPSPYGALSPYVAPHVYAAASLYAFAAAPSAPPPAPPAPYEDPDVALAAVVSPPFIFSHILPVKLKPKNYLYWCA
jgi:hypothetical protein